MMTDKPSFRTLTLASALCLLIAGALFWLDTPKPATAGTIASNPSTQPLDLGDNTFHVEPALLAELDKHVRQQTVPTTLEVQFVTDPRRARCLTALGGGNRLAQLRFHNKTPLL